MAKLGNQTILGNFPNDKFAGNGSKTAFTLSRVPGSVTSIDVYISGVKQDTSAYGVSGTTLTFTAAPPAPASGVVNNIEVCYKGVVGDVTTPGAGTVTKQSMANPYYAARAYRNAALSLPTGTNKITVDTQSFDSSGFNWVDLTNGRIKPTLAGYYQVSGSIRLNNSVSSSVCLYIYKNGALTSQGSFANYGATNQQSVVSDVIYLNGTSDYVEIYAYTSSAVGLDNGAVVGATNFISLVGPF